MASPGSFPRRGSVYRVVLDPTCTPFNLLRFDRRKVPLGGPIAEPSPQKPAPRRYDRKNRPPLTSRIAPVMKLAASPARK